MSEQAEVDAVYMFKGLVAARFRAKHVYYALIGNLAVFMNIWARNKVLYT